MYSLWGTDQHKGWDPQSSSVKCRGFLHVLILTLTRAQSPGIMLRPELGEDIAMGSWSYTFRVRSFLAVRPDETEIRQQVPGALALC